ncbi:LysR family transcriptional regulator [Paramicrobacterium chengjingii]|uniref:LysR family transcriptional regulator n=1 Tax=Paramicrobacterium chengjingii TaxID=2769067 RepID=UPI00142293CB|nr:LysR family transcriptional regulator [Microbacterium chengjingii]
MELRHLRYFTVVAECGSLTAAAAQLHISQPPLSVAIAQLESDLGARLFTRTARGVDLTSAGHFLLDACTRILGEIDETTAALGRFGSGTEGVVTFAAVPTLMWHRVPAFLRTFAALRPGVEIRLSDPPPWTAIDQVRERRVDVAAIMVADPENFTERHSATLDISDWGEIPLVAALPPDSTDAPSPLPLSAFSGTTVVLPRRTSAVPSLPEIVDEAFDTHAVVPASIRSTETIQTSIPLVEAGIAHALLPDPDGASLARFNLTVRSLAPQPRPLKALLVTRHGARKNPLIAGVLEHAIFDRVR